MNGHKSEREEDRQRKARPDERGETPPAGKDRSPEPLDEKSLDEVMRDCPL